jgi:hypothetical protein
MGKIVVKANVFDDSSVTEHDYSGQLIDFIQQQYPTGWPEGAWTVWADGNLLDVDDWDKPVTGIVVIMGAPGANPTFWIALGKAVLSTLVSALISYLLFPKQRKAGDRDSSNFFTIEGQQNVPRIGEPIPVQYGRVARYPPVASQPWSYVDNNVGIQYFHEILCLGQGEFDIHKVEIGTTEFQSDPNGVQWWIVPPTLHLGKYGYIENTIGIHEDVVTSYEVQNVNLTKASLVSPSGKLNNTTLGSKTIVFKDPVSVSFVIGNLVMIQSESPNQFLPGSVSTHPLNQDPYTSKLGVYNTITAISSDRKTLTFQFAMPMGGAPLGDQKVQVTRIVDDSGIRGWFNVCMPGKTVNKIQIEITFPNGLVRYDDEGDANDKSVVHYLEIQQIDDLGVNIGAPTQQAIANTARKTSILVRTYDYTVPTGRYKVRLSRAIADDSKNNHVSASVWTALRGFVVHQANEDAYGDVTLIAFKMKATAVIAEAARSKIRVTATRKLQTILSNFATAKVATVNPIDAFADLVRAPYAARLGNDYLDIPALQATANKLASTNGFNHVFESRTTVWDAMQIIGQAYRARPMATRKQINLKLLRAEATEAAVFSKEAFLPDSYNTAYRIGEYIELDGYRAYYRDPITWDERFVTWPILANVPEEVRLDGITSQAHALAHVQTMWEAMLKTRKLAEFQTELDAHLVTPGDRIAVVPPIVNWTQTARCIEILPGNQYRMDKLIEPGTRVLVLRSEYGEPSIKYTLNIPTATDVITLPSAATFPIYAPGDGMEATHFMFGDATGVSESYTVQTVTPSGMTATIEVTEYVPSVFTIAPIPGEV